MRLPCNEVMRHAAKFSALANIADAVIYVCEYAWSKGTSTAGRDGQARQKLHHRPKQTQRCHASAANSSLREMTF